MERPDPDLKNSPAERFLVLDGLRGIAALLVLMAHYDAMLGQKGLFRFGYLSVDFFFLLSGFVLVPIFESPTRWNGFARGMGARFLRFWPLIAVGSLMGAAVHLLRWPPDLVLLFLSMGLLCLPFGVGDHHWFSMNLPQWSLFIELVANALHLLVLRRIPSSVLAAIAIACGAVLATTGRLVPFIDGTTGDLVLGLLRAGCAYPLGIVLGRERTRLTMLPKLAWWAAPAAFLGAILIPPLLPLPGLVAEQLACLAFPLVLIMGVATTLPVDHVPAVRWLGMISFPLYATHFPLIEGVGLYARELPGPVRTPLVIAALVLAVFLADRLGRSSLAQGLRWPSRRTIVGTAAAR